MKPRNRKIPSVFRTPGRLLRWNRRVRKEEGVPMPAAVTMKSCASVVSILREQVRAGRLHGRSLICNDSRRIKAQGPSQKRFDKARAPVIY